MFDLDRWDVALLAIAGYVAVVTLTKMMAQHRDRLVADLERQAVAEQRRQKADARRQAQRSRKKQNQDAA